MSVPIVNLGIDLANSFDPQKAIRLEEACKLIRGRNGPLNLDVARRWAAKGCRPAGELGPRLILPSIRWNGVRLLMVEWIQAFEKARARIAAMPPVKVEGRSRREAQAAYEKAVKILEG